MNSLKLWRALQTVPDQHPLFKYFLQYDHRQHYPVLTGTFFLYLFTCSALGFCWSFAFQLLLPILLLLGIIFANTIYSVIWALSIGDTIVKERQHNRYDLLALTPGGRFSINWLSASASLHKRVSFSWIPFLVRSLVLIIFLTLGGALFISLFLLRSDRSFMPTYEANLTILPLIFSGALLVLAFYVDHMMSIMSASLIAMTIPNYCKDIIDSRIKIASLILLLQTCIYAFFIWLTFYGLPTIFNFLNLSPGALILLCIAISLILFCFIREIIVRTLWRILNDTLDADSTEMTHLLTKMTDSRLFS
ncbi:hypothetical protein MASR2M15_21560 [Anaerolineales bacterium]